MFDHIFVLCICALRFIHFVSMTWTRVSHRHFPIISLPPSTASSTLPPSSPPPATTHDHSDFVALSVPPPTSIQTLVLSMPPDSTHLRPSLDSMHLCPCAILYIPSRLIGNQTVQPPVAHRTPHVMYYCSLHLHRHTTTASSLHCPVTLAY